MPRYRKIFIIFVIGLSFSLAAKMKGEANAPAQFFHSHKSNSFAMNKEIFKDIYGYNGIYQISNFGTVTSIDRVVNSSFNATRKVKGVILKQHLSTHGYYYVVLTQNSISKKHSIHRLKAIAFIPNPDNKPCINHKNSIRTDNELTNLEWVTYSENTIHGFNYGLIKNNMTGRFGKNCPTSKPVIQLTLDNEYVNEFESIKQAEEITGILNLSNVCNGKRIKAGNYKWKFKQNEKTFL